MRQRLRKMLSHKPTIIGLLVMQFITYAIESHSADRHFIIKNPANTNIVIFVHGFTGGYLATWGKLPELLQKDPSLDSYDFLFWGYPSKFFGANENIGTTGQHLKTEIDYLPKTYDRVTLIGHSMGGLVIRSYIVQALIDGKGNDLKSIANVILFGTPNEGLGKADAIPKIVNDQIADLGLASELIVTLRKYWVQRVTSTQRHDEYNRQIPTLAVAGYTDNFVSKESVKSFFLDTDITDGDHTSMVKPDNTEHLTYRIIKARLLRAIKASITDIAPLTLWIEVTKNPLTVLWPSLSDGFKMKNVRDKQVKWSFNNFPTPIFSLHGKDTEGALEANVWSDHFPVKGNLEHIIAQTTKEHVFSIVIGYGNLSNQQKITIITDDPTDLKNRFLNALNPPLPR